MRRRGRRVQHDDRQLTDLFASAVHEAETLSLTPEETGAHVAATLAHHGTDAIECIRARRRLRGLPPIGGLPRKG